MHVFDFLRQNKPFLWANYRFMTFKKAVRQILEWIKNKRKQKKLNKKPTTKC